MTFQNSRPTVLRNVTCIYCGEAGKRLTTEHVIGRRFVPRGTLDKTWNLIGNACAVCNGVKSDLEDDISAVTMQPDVTGKHVSDDPLLAAEGKRKARRSFSRHTKKLVGDSTTQHSIQGREPPGMSWSFSMVAPPQVQPDRIEHLASLQATAFFYLLTYDESVKAGRFYPGVFAMANSAPAMDWGNATQRCFMDTIPKWEHRLMISTARGYFRAGIWKSPSSQCWGWAFEWNMTLRAIGFFGDESPVVETLDALSRRPGLIYPQEDGSTIILRKEVPLNRDDDMLFTFADAT